MSSFSAIIFLLKIMLHLLVATFKCEPFSNEVKYPIENEDNLYRFEFEVSQALSMSIWNETRKTYQPVLKINGSFYMRNRMSSSSCASLFHLNKSLSDSLIKVAGRHRSMKLINQQFPGTPIVVPLNAEVEVLVRNKMMVEAVSIHWHGQTQKGTFYMDGVSRLTQCSIGPGESFLYRFKATDTGTHFYHAHVGMQRNDGLYGPFIVTEMSKTRKSSMYPTYDKEFYFIVHDWYQEGSNSLQNRVIWEEMRYSSGFENLESCYSSARIDDGTAGTMLPFNRKTDAILINGKGSYKVMDQVNKLKNVDYVLSSQAFDLDLEEFEVKPNKKYVFRVIGANAGHALEIRIGGHKLHVIAADGNPIKTIEVDSLIINGGERFDFYIMTKGLENRVNYFIVVRTLETKDDNFKEITADNFGLAILKYSNVKSDKAACSDACQECSLKNHCTKLNCPFWPNESDGAYKCIPANKMRSTNIPESDSDLLEKNYTPSNFEEHFLNFHFSGSTSLRSSINGKRFVMPSIPPYFRSDLNSVLKSCSPHCFKEDESCECSHKLQIGTNKTIQLVMYNMGNGAGIEGNSHPIHLHGHNFYVIHMGFPSYHENNHTYNRLNQDLNCFNDSQVCSKGEWRKSDWKYGNLPQMNLVDPPLKDTISIPVGGYVVVRFKSNNLGYWMLHCHIDIHHGEGMAMIIQEGGGEEISKAVNLQEVNFCENNLDEIMRIKGSETVATNSKLTQFLTHFFEPISKTFSNFFSNKH